MARRGRPTVEINLSAEERATLERWARRHSSSQALALRSKIVLACAAGSATHAEIAAELGCNPVTVGKWRNRFAEGRLDGLVDAPRPGAARTIGDDVIEAVVVETLESAPPDATHWSTRSLGRQARDQPHHGARDLAGLRAQTLARGQFQGVARPGPGGEDPRPGRALHEPAGRGRGVRHRRETPDPGAQSHRPDLAHAADHPGPGHPRLRAQRHLRSLRRPQRGHRDGDHRHPQVPHQRRLHRLFEQGQPRSPRRARRARDPRQLRPTRPLWSTAGCCATAGSTSTSPRPTDRG